LDVVQARLFGIEAEVLKTKGGVDAVEQFG
jgi:hypothetical protein